MIHVELSEFGPTERTGSQRLYVLQDDDGPDDPAVFHWGNTGTGPHRAGRGVLADALGVKPQQSLVGDFAVDVVAHLVGPWRLRRGPVLRWVRGWCAEHGMEVLPTVVRELPPVEPLPLRARARCC